MNRNLLFATLTAGLALAGVIAAQTAAPRLERPLPKTIIRGNLHVDGERTWNAQHVVIHGDLILEEGGRLEVNDSVVELVGEAAGDRVIRWRGGALLTIDSTLGGTPGTDDAPSAPADLLLLDGDWGTTRTTLQHIGELRVGGAPPGGHLWGTGLTARDQVGPVLLSGAGRIDLVDSDVRIEPAP
ncbi:MAG TPA: hypothetical protein PLS90_12495 [Candidatus Sumerlaeota bacterium]|nr:hypothetical protein [Candidatus Sumerlaeota bacterium]HOR27773.1 hypothetical protein [Candidatus Sumerlaeota bacterium]HPK03264.1 hypothetical protein [Candidatus Sumerlaeota bacterium]